jgi:hypothetical protein
MTINIERDTVIVKVPNVAGIPGTEGWYMGATKHPDNTPIWHYGLRKHVSTGLYAGTEGFFIQCTDYLHGYADWHGPFRAPQPADFPKAEICGKCLHTNGLTREGVSCLR